MGKIVKPTDFVGKYSITQNSQVEANLQAFIDKYEKVYLRDLFGLVMGDLFYADIAPATFLPPVNADYATLFNPIAEVINGCEVISDGVKEMLTAFIYWEFTKAQPVINTPTGNVIMENEVSKSADWCATQIYSIYNESVKSYRAIQIVASNDKTTYPDYLGKMKTYNAWFL